MTARALPDAASVIAALEVRDTPSAPRPREERPAASQKLLALARRLEAPGADVEDPCAAWVGFTCARTALAPFYRALDELAAGSARHHASVATLGNSLIASDHITDVVRERLATRFGNGGRGFVLADRISDYGRRTRTGIARAGDWTPHNFAMGERGPYPFGVAGVLHVSTRKGARTRWTLDGERRAEVLWWDHEGASPFSLLVDGHEVTRVEPDKAAGQKRVHVDLPEGAARLELVADGPGVVSYGAILERATPGFIWSTFGVPAAGATTFFEADAGLFREHLRAQRPSLVVVMLGGNETKRIHWGKRSKATVAADFGRLLDKLRQDAPEAACLAIGPIDSVDRDPPDPFRTRHHLPWVIRTQRRIALEKGCAYLDLFEAMGGSGSLKRFHDRGLLHDDLVHPRREGLDVLGELIADALLRAWESTPVVDEAALLARTGSLAPGLLEPVAARSADTPSLPRTARALGVTGPARKRFAVAFGSDRDDAGVLAAVLKRRLSSRMSGAGGALSFASADGTSLAFSGSVERHEASALGKGSPVGLSGDRLRLGPDGKVAITTDGRGGSLHLAWLHLPTSGGLLAQIGSEAAAPVTPAARSEDGPVRSAKLALPEGASSVVLSVAAEGERRELHLVALALEPKGRRAVVDAWSPPSLVEWGDYNAGVTAATVAARGYDLLLLAPSASALASAAPELEGALAPLRRGGRDADCVLVSPIGKDADEAARLDARARQLASAARCAFLSATDRLGGAAGLALFQARGWLDDHARLTDDGAARFAELLLVELLHAARPTSAKLAARGTAR